MQKLLWLDMEMTGLDPEKERVIEVAVIITDLSFKVLDSFESVVFQEQRFLDGMDDWNTEHHTASGLVAKIPAAPKQAWVEEQICRLVTKHFGQEPAVLAGNSIGQDRKFIDRYFLKLASQLHYRMLDVTSWKVVFENFYGKKFAKQDKHRALDDIQESIRELEFYMGFIPLKLNPTEKS
jgi:oligoribonuclease